MISWWAYPLIDEQNWIVLISWTFWVIFAITLHELGHAWSAIWQGDETPREYGRLSLNPMVHMGPYSIIAFVLIGLAWGLTPINPNRFRWGRLGRVVVAAAGPLTNLLLAIVCSVLYAALLSWSPEATSEPALLDNVLTLLDVGIYINLLLLLFNLLPIPPLDGSQILAASFKPIDRLVHRPEAALFGLAVVMLIFLSGLDIVIASIVEGQSEGLKAWSVWLLPGSGG
jgi:Zn-dependent protease